MTLEELTNDEGRERALTEIEEIGRECARTKAHLHGMDASKKAIIAQEMKLAESKGVTSAAAQERDALAGGRYMEWIKDSTDAVEQYELARLALEARKMRFEAWRTVVATERALANLAR